MAERLWRKQLVILAAIVISSLSFLPVATTNVAADGTTYSLAAAESSGYVSVNIVGSAVTGSFTSVNLINGSGVFFGKCIDITVTGMTATDINIELKAGQRLVSSETSVQDMVVTESYSFALASGSMWQQTIQADCINMHEYAPDERTTYSLGSMTTGDLYDLAVYCEEHDAHDGVAQGAIWAETDSATADDLEAYGLTTTAIESANSMYKSVTGESIEGVGGSTTGTGDTSDFFQTWIIIAVVTIVVVVVILGFLFLGKGRNRAGGKNGAYYPQNNPPYPPNQPGYPQSNQPYQQPYRPGYPQQNQQGMPAQVPPVQPPAAPPQQPVQQALNVVSFCPNCGTKTDGRSLSCPSCGWYLGRK